MIMSVVNDVARIRGTNGFTFDVRLEKQVVQVPSRDGTGGTCVGFFDFKKLILEDEVARGTTADEATSAAFIIRRTWPDCTEKFHCLSILHRFMNDKRQERRDDAVMQLVELYGVARARLLSAAVRRRVFAFPAFYMRERPVAQVVIHLLDVCRGSTGSLQFPPSSVAQAKRLMHRITHSKGAVGFSQLVDKLGIADSRIGAAFEIAKYLETNY